MSDTISITINDNTLTVKTEYLDISLSQYLREVLKLSGTKQSCDSEGTCGACTVIINGKARRSCLTKMKKLDGAVIETIESLQITNEEPIPHPLVQTVIQDGIFQCGYCAPGALLAAKALIDNKPNPTDSEIEKALSTVICRCAGLHRMDKSVQRAAAIIRGEEKSTWTIEDTKNEHLMLNKITGVMKYSDDLSFPNMLFAQVLRADIPHAKINSINTSKAEQAPGIVRILTHKDIPGNNIYGLITPDQPALCSDRVLYAGDPIAIVIGETQEQIQEALEKIEVDYSPLPIIPDPEYAMTPEAPILHERLKKEHPECPNVISHYKIDKGDLQKGFDQADIIIEDEYEVPFIEHAYMEIEASIAVPEADGSFTIYCGSQSPVDDARQIAGVLGEAQNKINVAHMYPGGGFGGKEDISTQIHAALAAQATGKPVKIRWSRAESLLVSYKRHAEKMHYKMGASKDGRLVAAEVKIIGDTGAYASAGEAVLYRSNNFACGPYLVPNALVNSYAVHTNNMPCGAFRGYGGTQVSFSSEVHLQKICDALKMDPFEFRFANLLDIGDATITGDVLNETVSAGAKPCLMAVKKELDKASMPKLKENEKYGVGIAVAYKNVGLGSNIPDESKAKVSLEPDGHFLVRHGAVDMGQGANEVMAIIVSRVFGIPLSMIRVHNGDTRVDPEGGMTTASRATFMSGNATLLAANNLKDKIWKAVCEEFSVPPEDLSINNGAFINNKTKREFIKISDFAKGSTKFVGEYHYIAPKTQPAKEKVDAFPENPEAPLHFSYCYGAQAAQVAVNTETGEIRVLRLIAAHDVGLPLSERNVIGQLEGAAIQGIGYALTESFPMKDGIPQSTKFKDLGLIRFRDIPEIIPIIVEDPHPQGPFGAKGMGELALSPAAPAIANAVHDATGIWINSLPITSEKVLKALKK